MNPADNIESAIEKLQITTTAETDAHILDDAFAALEESTQKQPPDVAQSVGQRTLIIRIAELAAVAAVVLVIFALFFGIFDAKAIELHRLYEALAKVQNISISSFVSDKTEPAQKVWASRTLNIKVQETENQAVLFDIPNRIRKIKDFNTSSIQTTIVPLDFLAKVEDSIAGSFGLLPFPDINDVPEDYQWNRVDDTRVAAIVPGTEVYELTWLEKDGLPRKWRVFVDAGTDLPKRVEWYHKLKPEEDYRFATFTVITYPGERQIQLLVRETFGSDAGTQNEPEFLSTPPH